MNIWMNTYYGSGGSYLEFKLRDLSGFSKYMTDILLDSGSKLVIF